MFLRTLPASRFPALAAHGALAWTNDRDQRFSSGLETLLHGVREALGPVVHREGNVFGIQICHDVTSKQGRTVLASVNP